MKTFLFISAFLGLIIFATFVCFLIAKFRLQRSYSYYAHLVDEKFPINRETRLWSIITVVVALCLVPSMVELGKGNPWQLLGFFAPVYLIVVACTPKYLEDKRQRIIHFVGSGLCAVVTLAWLFFVAQVWWAVAITYLVALLAAFATKTETTSYVLWGELGLFAAVFAALFFSLIMM